jgi:hypothetical protein
MAIFIAHVPLITGGISPQRSEMYSLPQGDDIFPHFEYDLFLLLLV